MKQIFFLKKKKKEVLLNEKRKQLKIFMHIAHGILYSEILIDETSCDF
jgi:hypothetical protein